MGFTGKFESSNVSRDNVSMGIGRSRSEARPRRLGTFRGPLVRGPLIVSLYVLI